MDKDLSVIPVGESKALVPALTHEFDFEGASGKTYEAFSVSGKPLAETPVFKLVVTKLPSDQLGLTMVATDASMNDYILKQAHMLSTLQAIAAELDAEAKIKPMYGNFFPTVVDTMDTGEETKREGLVMGYAADVVKTYKQLIPLPVALKDARVDLQTAVWLLGKTLKVMDFVHAMGFSVGFVDETNILVEPTYHGVFILNWMDAEEEASASDQRADIVALAKIVWQAAGGTDKAEPPFDAGVMSKEGHDEFVAFLSRMMKGEVKSASEEMTALYTLADRIWDRVPDPKGYNEDKKKRPFHTWVTYPVK